MEEIFSQTFTADDSLYEMFRKYIIQAQIVQETQEMRLLFQWYDYILT